MKSRFHLPPSGRWGSFTIPAILLALCVDTAYTQQNSVLQGPSVADSVSLADRQAERGASVGKTLSSNPTALGTTIVALQEQLAETERRVTELERRLSKIGAAGGGADDTNAQPANTTVVAPFTVVDQDGQVLFKVSKFGDLAIAVVASANGNVAGLSADSSTASMLASSGGPNGSMAVVGTRDNESGGLRVKFGGTDRFSAGLFKDHTGLTGLQIRNASGQLKTRLGNTDQFAVLNLEADSGKPSTGIRMAAKADDSNIDLANDNGFVASLRGTAEGGSVILTGAAGGYTAAKLGVGDKGGFLNVFSSSGGNARASVRGDGLLAVMAPNGTIVGNLYADDKDDGYLSLGSPNGNELVEMAVSRQNRVGFVRLGPASGGFAQSVNGVGQQASILIGKRSSN